MKKTLIKNYWLAIMSWSMFLSGYVFLSKLLMLVGFVLILINTKKVNYWRVISIGLLLSVVFWFSLEKSNIPYFFPELKTFILFISFNASITFEKLYSYRYRSLLPIMLVMLVSVFILSVIILIVPNDSYSIFTKKNLFLMESFIFLPYYLPLTLCVVYKLSRSYKLKLVASRVEVTNF